MKRLRKFLLILSVFSVLLFATACGIGQNKPVQTEDFAMGTIIDQKVYGGQAQKASTEVSQKIKDLDALLTISKPGGDINKLNDNAGRGYVELNPETISILKSARKISDLSSGAALNITVAPLVKEWGIGTDHPQVPTPETIKRLLSLANYRDVEIDEATNRARLLKAGEMVDLGGIAKGYAGDAAIEIYKKNGVTSAFANLGGNVVVLGNKPDGTPWSVGIQNPRAPNGSIVGVVHVTDKAVVTSGDYQRYFTQDGKRYCHILDPHTGYPADSGLMSVTIITSSSTDADALSKAFVLGLDKGIELVRRYGKAEAIFITNDKKIYVTPGLQGNFQLEDETHEYTYVQKG